MVEPELELSVVMPCLNEAETVALCVTKARTWMRQHGVQGEVLIADNGSTDGSQALAEAAGARVVEVAHKGYGNALMGGIRVANGRYVIMGDADDSYEFSNLLPFVEKLRQGYDLVMGNRFLGDIKPGAMPPLHRYLGNPVLTLIGRVFFCSPCRDFHCGLRGFSREAFERMDLMTTGMEFASEMVIKAQLLQMRVCEVPTTLSPDGRSRPPHLRSWRDGWRHLRFMLLFSPRWLFLYPGLALILMGLGWGSLVFLGQKPNTLVYCAGMILVGFQSVFFAIFTKVFTIREGLLPPDPRFVAWRQLLNLEVGIIAGLLLVGAGLALAIYGLLLWSSAGYGSLDPFNTLRVVIPSMLMMTLGVQFIFNSFFLTVLGLPRRRTIENP